MKTFLLSIVVLVQIICHSSCFARLGEDEIQCEERYGFAKKEFVVNDKTFPLITGEGTVTRSYLYQRWRIRVGFLDGVAVREEYWKSSGPGRSTTIADFESNAVLDGEKGNGSWQPKGTKLTVNIQQTLQNHLSNMLAGSVWIRSDGNATATLDLTHLHMSFESLTAIQHDEAIKQASDQKQRASVPTF